LELCIIASYHIRREYDYHAQKETDDQEAYARIEQQSQRILGVEEDNQRPQKELTSSYAVVSYQKKELDELRDLLVAARAEQRPMRRAVSGTSPVLLFRLKTARSNAKNKRAICLLQDLSLGTTGQLGSSKTSVTSHIAGTCAQGAPYMMKISPGRAFS
jgi:hypothetical protein